VGLDRKPVSAPAFWEALYAEGQDGWELGEPSPALGAWLAKGGRFVRRLGEREGHGSASAEGDEARARVAVPGCGRGHDVRLLARQGYHAVGFDFAAPAVAEARRLAAAEGVDTTFEQRDVFTLGRDYREAFDGVWEYTCFCAIDPGRRAEYVHVLRTTLKQGGTLLACFYPLRDGGDGPPFPVARDEVERLLTPHFTIIDSSAPAASIERRRGLEWMVRAVRA
jgi:methyl halide transferase